MKTLLAHAKNILLDPRPSLSALRGKLVDRIGSSLSGYEPGKETTPGDMRRPSVIMLVADDRIDRRVLLEGRSLFNAGWTVTVVGAPAPTPDDRADEEAFPELDIIRVDASKAVQIPDELACSQTLPPEEDWNDFYWLTNHFYLEAAKRPHDVIVAHDLPILAAAAHAAIFHDALLVYDSHEIYPEQHHFGAERTARYDRADKALSPLADLVVTVNESIAALMSERYAIPKPEVILNCPDSIPAQEMSESTLNLRDLLSVDRDVKLLLFQGSLSLNRNLENLTAAMEFVKNPKVALVFLGPGDAKREELKQIAIEKNLLDERVFFLPPVAQKELLLLTRSADVGIIPYPHIDLNSLYCSPNKLFEFLASGLPILANDSPELRRFVQEQGVGLVHSMADSSAIAAAIDKVFDLDLEQYRQKLKPLSEQYTWPVEGEKIVQLYNQLKTKQIPQWKTSLM